MVLPNVNYKIDVEDTDFKVLKIEFLLFGYLRAETFIFYPWGKWIIQNQLSSVLDLVIICSLFLRPLKTVLNSMLISISMLQFSM